MNEYFQPGAVPAPSSPGSSAVMRQEFASIASGFDKLPVMGGHAGEIVVVNPTGTALMTTGSIIGDYVTKDGAFTLTNKTMSWADNTWVGFGDAATRNAGLNAGQVLLLSQNATLPAMDASNLSNIPGLSLKADANNAVLTGAPVCPTPPTGDSGARIANTQFVTETLQAIGTFAPSNATPLMDGIATPGASPLGSRGDHVHPSDTSRAPVSAGTAIGTTFVAGGGVSATNVQAAIDELDAEKAPLASPAFTGNPTAPTPLTASNDTLIATTAFVKSVTGDLAPLASPAFTGNPTAPTPLTADNDTSIATTAFVQTLVAQQPFGMLPSNGTPLMNGAAACGVGVEGSRYDHVHPVDTSRAPTSAATATGTSFTPAGTIAATTVQAAIAELDTETQARFAGVPFCKNKLFNGEVTRINQRAFAGNFATLNTWNSGNTIAQQELCYGYDMWAKASATEMLQIIEAGNFKPSTQHTLSGTNVTTQQITSPASGNWAITVPQTARNVQVEEGAVATPFEMRPIGFELAQCQRYWERVNLYQAGNIISGGSLGTVAYFKVDKRTTPDVALNSNSSGNLSSPTVISGSSRLLVYAGGVSVGNATLNVTYDCSAVI